MYELGGSIVAHAAAVQGQGGISKFGGGDPGKTNIDCHGLHVQAVLRDAMTVRAKPLVTPRRSITTHNIDFGAGTPQFDGQVVEQVEDPRVIIVHLAGPMITQEVIEFGQGGGVVAVAVAIDDVEPLSSVGMEEMKAIGGL